MPEIKLPEVRLPGLRDMRPDDIKQALADVPRPDIKLSDFDPRSLELPRIDLSRIDLAAAANAAVERTPLRRQRPSRLPMVVAGLVIAGLSTLAVMNLGWVRARVTELVESVRNRLDAARVNDSLEPVQLDADAYTGTIGIPIQADTFADTIPTGEPTPVESGIGATNGSYDTAGFDGGTPSEQRDEGQTSSY